jgi:Endopolygalacturonase
MRKISFISLVLICTLNLLRLSAINPVGESQPVNKFRKVILPTIPPKLYKVTDFGVTTSSKDNTSSIQKTIDACNAAGGGVVVIPKGVYLCGPLLLKSNIDLQILEGAVLKMLPYGKGNGIEPGTYPNNGQEGIYPSFIAGEKASNIRVSGKGLIEGQGADWWAAYRLVKGTSTTMKRGCLIAFNGCNNAEISGVILKNAPNVHIAVGKKCSDVTINGITIDSPEDAPNTDGIDTWAPNIVIKNSKIECGDDNIAMDAGTQNITVKNCYFGRGHGCSIGSYTHNIKYVLVDSCTFNGTSSAIRMKSSRNRGGGEECITYSNLTIENVKGPISITSYYPKVPKKVEDDVAQPITDNTPTWRDITLKNIKISGCEKAGEIWGVPEMPITNVLFDNVQISSGKGLILNYSKDIRFVNTTIKNSIGDAVTMYNSNQDGIDPVSGKAVKSKK